MGSTPDLVEWATFSERAVFGASAVYALALLAFVAEWSLGPQGLRVGAAVERERRREAAEAHRSGRVALSRGGAVDGRRAELFGRIGFSLTAVGGLLHLAALVSRGLAAGRVPWGNMYEFALAGSFAAVAVFLVAVAVASATRWLGPPLVFIVLAVLMAASLLLYVPAGPLLPALHSYWLVIHVIAAVLATGAFTLGAIASLTYLLRERAQRRGSRGLLPDADTIDQLAYRIHAFAFPIWTFAALVAGPIWAKYAWGRYWGWDPKEVWAFITWVVYASYLHARVTGGWRGRRAAWVALAGFATLLFNFVGINLFGSGLHSYAGL